MKTYKLAINNDRGDGMNNLFFLYVMTVCDNDKCNIIGFDQQESCMILTFEKSRAFKRAMKRIEKNYSNLIRVNKEIWIYV